MTSRRTACARLACLLHLAALPGLCQQVVIRPHRSNYFLVRAADDRSKGQVRFTIAAGEDVWLGTVNIVVHANTRQVIFRKREHTMTRIVYEARNVPVDAFLSARIQGSYRTDEDRGTPGTYDIWLSDLDLGGDSDHTGFVEHSAAEEEGEDADGEQGVIVLPNWDDDDPPGSPGYGVPDALIENQFAKVIFPNRADRFDNRINSASDRDEDMQVLTIRKVPRLPPGWRVVLRAAPAEAEAIRIFDESDRPVILPKDAAAFVSSKRNERNNEHEVRNLAGRSDEFLNYHIEGILPGARVRLELVALEGTVERAKDALRVRVAPFLLLPNEARPLQSFTSGWDSVPPELRLAALPGVRIDWHAMRSAFARLMKVTTAPPSVSFWQDAILAGYAQAPGPGRVRTMMLLARLPNRASNFLDVRLRGRIPANLQMRSALSHWTWPNRAADLFRREDQPQHQPLLRDGVGVFEIGDLPEHDAVPANYGGNVQLAGNVSGFAQGRVVIGKQMAKSYRDFFLRQEVQAPPLELDLEWLFIKHVDEVAYFLPQGAVAVASPSLGEKLFREHFLKAADPSALVFLKGTMVARGTLASVETQGAELWLTGSNVEGAPVHPDMYLHIYTGRGRYQTYAIVAVERSRIKVRQDEALVLSFWRASALELPGPGSRYVVFDQPLHNRKSQVLTLTLSELLDDGNARVRDFWRQNAKAAAAIKSKVLPQLQSLGPTRVVELPVLFHETSDKEFGNGSTAFTPNLVNGHLLERTFVMPKPFALGHPVDLFEDAAVKALSGLRAEFIDDYFLFHNAFGEVHCAVNVIREPTHTGPYWWQSR